MSASAYTSPFWARQNPIFVRCLRSRLRPNQALAYGAITVVIAGFIFAMVFLAGGRVAGTAIVARTAIVPLLALQSFILLLLGTGSAATGVALERDLGMLDFHRMTPMSPTSKILGFLFGLPVREYFMFALTLPFMLAAFVLAEVSLFRVLELYVVFGSGVLLYHLTGMAAGMVTKRARRASWLAQAIVLILYFVLPQFGHAGFTSFSYLTYMPTLRSLLAEEAGVGGWSIVAELQKAFGLGAEIDVPFFGLMLRASLYSLFIQGLASLSFFLIVRRKLKDEAAPSFGKTYAVALFAAVTTLLVGSVWPYWVGAVKKLSLFALAKGGGATFQPEAALLVFVVLIVVFGAFVLSIVTPGEASFLRGIRRARRLKLQHAPPRADEAPGLWVALALAGICAAGYLSLVVYALRNGGAGLAGGTGIAEALVPATIMGLTLVEVHGARARLEGKLFLVYVFGLWIVPLMVMAVLAAAAGYSTPMGMLGSISPLWSIQASVHPLFLAMGKSAGLPRGSWEVVIAAVVLRVGFAAFFFTQTRALHARLLQRDAAPEGKTQASTTR